ncbi:molybdopterin-dependent oxidoreductase [Thalassolituus sp.]|uniref:molybdopterin-dependent oxidoreductase n=1 Tax=Thalassolituus sp. TaxID=2030822 RepID=UPI003519B74B
MNISVTETREDTTACILCSRNCGLSVEVDDTGFKKIRGDEQHPMTEGYICQKAGRLEYYQNNADRLTQPLKRKEDGSFEEVPWDQAINEIATKMNLIRDTHGGEAFATCGGGGQGNHLGGGYLAQLRAAMKSHFNYNSLGQEKTGDFWLNGRLFGSQACHITEDIEHSDFVIFLGCNPFQAHGIPNARHTLNQISKDSSRTMVVIDPRRTETARMADIHLQLKPGTDAYLLSAILAIIVNEGLQAKEFLAEHCTGFASVERYLKSVPVEEFIRRADVNSDDVYRVARGLAKADSGCVRADLGIQHSIRTTLNGYFEKLLYLVTGQFGKKGGNNLHTTIIPILTDTDERNPKYRRSVYHKMFAVSGILPPNILADEILLAGDKRIRSIFVDSCNPINTWADSDRMTEAFKSLDLLVATDVALTETARLAHYVLPAASQFEKWEFTGFNLEFPVNGFHLRHPLFPAYGNTLPEPEIYTRILEAMGKIPKDFPVMKAIAQREPEGTFHLGFLMSLAAKLISNKKLKPFAASILYRTLGTALPNKGAAAAVMLPLSIVTSMRYHDGVKRAGFKGNRFTSGVRLFRAILQARSGLVYIRQKYDDVWSLVANKDQKIHLRIPEMLDEARALLQEPVDHDKPFTLIAGERRAYNANQIYRDPKWRKTDKTGAMRIHPDDAKALGLVAGDKVLCDSGYANIKVDIMIDDTMRRSVVALPHGYAITYDNGEEIGPALNRLMPSTHCDPFSRTPSHKYTPVSLAKA